MERSRPDIAPDDASYAIKMTYFFVERLLTSLDRKQK
jgi:hypothetical protein